MGLTMGIIQNAVMAETRGELRSLLKQKPNWRLSDEYQTIFLFSFGSEAKMNCTLKVFPYGQVHWCCVRAAANGRFIGNLSSRDFFPAAAEACVNLATDEVIPFLATADDTKAMIRLALHKAIETSRRPRVREDRWIEDIINVGRQSLATVDMPEERKSGWLWFLGTVEHIRSDRPLGDYRTLCLNEGRQWLGKLSLCRYAVDQMSVLRDSPGKRKSVSEDLFRQGWFRDNASMETMLLADGLI